MWKPHLTRERWNRIKFPVILGGVALLLLSPVIMLVIEHRSSAAQEKQVDEWHQPYHLEWWVQRDNEYGCEYIVLPMFRGGVGAGITPRLDSEGKPVCRPELKTPIKEDH